MRWIYHRYFWLRIKKIFGRRSRLAKLHYQQVFSLREELKRILQRNDFDIIQVEHSYLGEVLEGITNSTRKILDLHNVHSAMSSMNEKKQFLREEKRLSEIYDDALVCSMIEKDHAQISGFKSLHTVPNGVDTRYYAFRNGNGEVKRLIFIGDLTYDPNIDGVMWFLKKINPFLPSNMEVEIIGRMKKRLVKKTPSNVKFCGFVKDVRTKEKNSAFIVPIRSGGGTRLKIPMAASMGLPIITTTKGAEGLDLEDGKDLLLANTPYAFIKALEKLDDPKTRDRLRRSARKKIEKLYSWDVISKNYSDILDS